MRRKESKRVAATGRTPANGGAQRLGGEENDVEGYRG